MAEYYDQPITASTDWGGDASTDNKPVTGRRVQEFIKNELASKATKDLATTENDGLMSKEDKALLQELSSGGGTNVEPVDISFIKETKEPGFFVIDANRNIGFCVVNTGAHSANLVEFQNIV